jgi:mutator protein MutT
MLPRKPTPIAIAVVERQNRFLIGKRPASVALGGLWEFPGGKVEEAETAAQAAVRECLEETGLSIEVVEPYSEQVHSYEHDQVQLLFFACRLVGEESQAREPFRWVAREALGEYEFPAGNKGLLRLLLESV